MYTLLLVASLLAPASLPLEGDAPTNPSIKSPISPIVASTGRIDPDTSLNADPSPAFEHAADAGSTDDEEWSSWQAALATSGVVALTGAVATLSAAVLVVAMVFAFGIPSGGNGRILGKTVLSPLMVLFSFVPVTASLAAGVGSVAVLGDASNKQLTVIGLASAPGFVMATASAAAVAGGGLWMIFGPQKDYFSGLDIGGAAVFAGGLVAAPVGLFVLGTGLIGGAALAYSGAPAETDDDAAGGGAE